MKKILFTLILISFAQNVYSEKYSNPNWVNGITYNEITGVNSYVYTKPKLFLNLSFPIDFMDGIYFGVFYQFSIETRLSKIFNFDLSVKSGENIPDLKVISTSWLMYPIPFIQIAINYRYRNFYEYRIGEHNAAIFINAFFDFKKMPKWLEINFLFGADFKFIDLDIEDNSKTYREDWLSEIYLIWKIKTLFSPVFCYSFGLSLGNYDRYEVYSSNYLEFKFYNDFHLPKDFTLYLNFAFSYAGALPLAGIINRFYTEIGVQLEIQTD